jgi:hypothetical protein
MLPGVRLAPVEFSGAIQVSEPLDADGVRAASVSPAYALVDVGARTAVGASYYGAFEAGNTAAHSAGPVLQHAIPRGTITLELRSAWRMHAATCVSRFARALSEQGALTDVGRQLSCEHGRWDQ